ncbi:MAG: DAK2 domain-containing protein [Clostridia bacterium]|nr:DAK2 domain-containing protein [Clostridia bacterium]
MLKTIDGQSFKKLLISAANNLANNKKMVDDLNVFPVPDGDTGTNMSMTILAVKKELENSDDTSCGAVAEIASHASLRGARGNSGVILSQFLRGLAKGLKGVDEISVSSLISAMKVSVDVAYRAVMKPTEGTILTVARQMYEAAEKWDVSNEDLLEFFPYVIGSGDASLENTPNLLPQLKQAGVVDSGGMGLMVLVKGAYMALQGNEVSMQDEEVKGEESAKAIPQEDIKFGYCTEFIIRKKEEKAPWKALRKRLESIGDSVIVVDDTDIVKVHVHTNNPGIALEEAMKLGELMNIKIENMREQNRELAEKERREAENQPKVDFGFVSVAAGDGMTQIFEELGCQQIISGGQTMNPSTEDFLDRIAKINAKTIYLLPNNKNIILAAEQAKELSKGKNIVVLPTKTLVQGISAMLAFDPDTEAEQNTELMLEMISSVKSASVTFAARDSQVDGFEIKKDDIMGLVEGKIKVISKEVPEAVIKMLEELVAEDAVVSLYYGEDVSEEQAEDMKTSIEKQFPGIDVNVYNGGQPLYYYYISVEG